MSTLEVGKIVPATGTAITLGDSGDTFPIPASATLDVNGTIDVAGATLTGSFGKVLQVIGVTKADTFSHNTTSWVDITDMTVSITPAATSSKIYVTSSIACGQRGYTSYMWIKLVRDSTDVFVGDAAGSRNQVTVSGGMGDDYSQMTQAAISYIDSPNTTSATTYKLQMKCQNTDAQYINRSYVDTDSAVYSRAASSIIVMEIGA